MRLFLIILLGIFVFDSKAANSPIIYGQVAGVRCAYDLISSACVSTTSIATPVSIANGGTAKALTLSAGGVPYFDGDSFEVLAAGASGKVLTSGGAGAPTWETAASSQWTTDADGIYYDPADGDAVRIGSSQGPVTDGPTLQVMAPGTNTTTLFFSSSGAAGNGGLGMISLGDITGTFHDFVADLQGLNSADNAVRGISLNRQGGNVVIGSGAGTVLMPSYSDGTLSIASSVVTSSSDARMKDVQGPYERSLEDVRKFKGPKLYKWKKEFPEGGNAFTHAGFIAQEVEEAFPECVYEGSNGMLSLSTTCILAVALNSIKQLDIECVKKPKPVALVQTKLIAHPKRQKAVAIETPCIGSKKFCENQVKRKKVK